MEALAPLSLAGREEAAPARADLRADHIRTLYEQTSVTLAGNALGLILIASMFFGLAPRAVLGAWVAAVLALLLLRTALYLRFPGRAGASATLAQLEAWRRGWNGVALASAAGWGTAVWLFYGLGSEFHFVALLLIVFSYMLAGVQLLATQPRVYLAFISLGMLPTIARVATDSAQPYHLQLAGVLLLLFALTLGLSSVYRRAFESTIRLKVRTERLAAQLREEKAQAEAARREAEVANRAKTQFFAAASHDLRQPLHALGLFAEALRGRIHGDAAVAQLVNSINSSVDALEGLFSELLDITKIDSGAVVPRPESFRLGELFARLKLHFEPTAFEKGLRLAFRGSGLHAHADPLLVERILRNLLANAIRYTEDGSVLVSARRRGEDRLVLQVWDTGIGIAPAEQERIFEEFYQVGDEASRPALPAHHRKGLGLGLSIVKRLAALLGAPLALRSRPGHGTVVSLELPPGRAARSDGEAMVVPGPRQLTLSGRLLVVVEDEAAVREALVVLLQTWGAEVLAFDSYAACSAWSAAAERAPDLLIADHRLEAGHSGTEVIVRLRQRFGPALPALVVTGSALAGPEAEAERHGFHLLVKPVAPHRLRAMIGFKLGLR